MAAATRFAPNKTKRELHLHRWASGNDLRSGPIEKQEPGTPRESGGSHGIKERLYRASSRINPKVQIKPPSFPRSSA